MPSRTANTAASVRFLTSSLRNRFQVSFNGLAGKVSSLADFFVAEPSVTKLKICSSKAVTANLLANSSRLVSLLPLRARQACSGPKCARNGEVGVFPGGFAG